MSIEIKVKNKERFDDVSSRVRAAVDRFGDDVEVKVRPSVDITAEMKDLLSAIKKLQDHGARADVFTIANEVGGIDKAYALNELRKMKLVSEEKGVYSLTEAGKEAIKTIEEEKKKVRL